METTTKNTIPSYEMFSKQGNRMCHNLVCKIEKKVKGKYRVTKEEVIQMIVEGIKKISEKHSEVNDTEPEYHICSRVNGIFNEVGYTFDINRFEV